MFTKPISLEKWDKASDDPYLKNHQMYQIYEEKLRIFYKYQINKQFYDFSTTIQTRSNSIPFQRRKINNVPLRVILRNKPK